MPRRVAVPVAHGPAVAPGAALGRRGAGAVPARVLRPLGGNANMHWLVAGAEGVAVLRRYGPWHEAEDIAYELRVLEGVAARGWRVPLAVGEPWRAGRHWWCLFDYVPGRPRRPRTAATLDAERRDRGRLLADLHADLAALPDRGQRPGWRRREEVLGAASSPHEPALEALIAERVVLPEARIMLEYAARARDRFAAVGAAARPAQVVHGDLIGGNVLYRAGRLSGVIDFDLTHLDHRVADFVWTWRGRHDAVVHGYAAVSPLDEAELALLAPVYWTGVLESVRLRLLWEPAPGGPGRVSLPDAVLALQRRSPLTGE
jgi:Ser/Thr protein kinase RdoA (MazF antagonist)